MIVDLIEPEIDATHQLGTSDNSRSGCKITLSKVFQTTFNLNYVMPEVEQCSVLVTLNECLDWSES